MRTRKSWATVGLLTAGLLAVAPAGAAVADPKGETAELMCANGQTYDVVIAPGGGSFTPGLDVNSNTVLVPVEFVSFTGTVSQGGVELFTFTDDAGETKGSGKQRNTTTCSFVFTETFTLTEEEAEEEGLPGAGTYEFEGSGEVIVQVKGR